MKLQKKQVSDALKPREEEAIRILREKNARFAVTDLSGDTANHEDIVAFLEFTEALKKEECLVERKTGIA